MIPTNIDPISLPTTGHLHISPKGYITWEEHCKWDNVHKRPIGKRISIGKIADRKNRLFYPNKNYYELFPEEDPESSADSHSSVLSYAPYIALRKAAENTGCLQALRAFFPTDADRILAIAVHAVITEDSVASNFPYWFYHNYCGLSQSIADSHISELYSLIGQQPEKVKNFLYDFKEEFQKQNPGKSKVVLAFDSTNQNTHFSDNSLAEYGKAKLNENLPDINTAMFVDEKTGIPIYYEHFYGSILDKSETPVTLEKVEDLGYSKVFLMMDRGYADSETVKALTEGFEYGLMLPDGLKKAKELIKTTGPKIKDNHSYYIPSENIYGIKLDEKQDILGQKVTAYVFYDAARAQQERDSINSKVESLKNGVLSNRKRYTENLREKYEKWLIIEKKDDHKKGEPNFTIRDNEENIQACLNAAGYFMIISDTDLDAAHMIQIARCRDRVEKGFRDLKDHLGMTKAYTHHRETYEGKMFVSFIALVIRESYKWYLKDWLEKNRSQTVHTSLGELSKFEIEKKFDNNGWLARTSFTKRQKEVLSLLGLTENEVKTSIRSLTLA